jgi:hypothetical protein
MVRPYGREVNYPVSNWRENAADGLPGPEREERMRPSFIVGEDGDGTGASHITAIEKRTYHGPVTDIEQTIDGGGVAFRAGPSI